MIKDQNYKVSFYNVSNVDTKNKLKISYIFEKHIDRIIIFNYNLIIKNKLKISAKQ